MLSDNEKRMYFFLAKELFITVDCLMKTIPKKYIKEFIKEYLK